jgi:hypothetical protein
MLIYRMRSGSVEKTQIGCLKFWDDIAGIHVVSRRYEQYSCRERKKFGNDGLWVGEMATSLFSRTQ